MAIEQPPAALRDRVFKEISLDEDAAAPVQLPPARGPGISGPSGQANEEAAFVAAAGVLGCVTVVSSVLFSTLAQPRLASRKFHAQSAIRSVGLASGRPYAQDNDEAKRTAVEMAGGPREWFKYEGRSNSEVRLGGKRPDNAGIFNASPGFPVSADRSPTASPRCLRNSSPAAPATPFAAPAAQDRYLIRNATLVLEVKDARGANDRLVASTKQSRGYVSGLQESVDALGARTISLQVRVPAKLFDSSMQALAALGKVMEKHSCPPKT